MLIKSRSDPKQLPTVGTTISEVMATVAFRRGVADVRAGSSPSYDGDFGQMPMQPPSPGNLNSPTNQAWYYERYERGRAVEFYLRNCWDGIL
jgi:hypothetical protein